MYFKFLLETVVRYKEETPTYPEVDRQQTAEKH